MERQQPVGYIATGEGTLSQSMALSPDGKIIAHGADNIVYFWDVEKSNSIGKPLIGLGESGNIVMSLAFSPKEKMLATGYFDGTILLWNTETYQLIGQPLKGHTNQVDSLAFDPGGNVLASSSLDKTIILWDTHTYQPIGQPLVEYTEWVTSLVFNS